MHTVYNNIKKLFHLLMQVNLLFFNLRWSLAFSSIIKISVHILDTSYRISKKKELFCASLWYNCYSILINVKRKIGKHEMHSLVKGTLNKREGRVRKEDQDIRPPCPPSTGKSSFKSILRSEWLLRNWKNKYLRELKYEVTYGIHQPARHLEEFSVLTGIMSTIPSHPERCLEEGRKKSEPLGFFFFLMCSKVPR